MGVAFPGRPRTQKIRELLCGASAGIVEVRELLRSLARERGATVFVSSHILGEIAQLADRIGIMHEGRLIEELDREQLRAQERLYVRVGVSDTELLVGAGLDLTELTTVREDLERHFLRLTGGAA